MRTFFALTKTTFGIHSPPCWVEPEHLEITTTTATTAEEEEEEEEEKVIGTRQVAVKEVEDELRRGTDHNARVVTRPLGGVVRAPP